MCRGQSRRGITIPDDLLIPLSCSVKLMQDLARTHQLSRPRVLSAWKYMWNVNNVLGPRVGRNRSISSRSLYHLELWNQEATAIQFFPFKTLQPVASFFSQIYSVIIELTTQIFKLIFLILVKGRIDRSRSVPYHSRKTLLNILLDYIYMLKRLGDFCMRKIRIASDESWNASSLLLAWLQSLLRGKEAVHKLSRRKVASRLIKIEGKWVMVVILWERNIQLKTALTCRRGYRKNNSIIVWYQLTFHSLFIASWAKLTLLFSLGCKRNGDRFILPKADTDLESIHQSRSELLQL